MVAGFCLMPSDNAPPKTPIPIQPCAGSPHPSHLSCFYLGWSPMFHVYYMIYVPSILITRRQDPDRHSPCLKFHIYMGDTGSQQASQSPSKPNCATAPLIPYFECSDFHSMLKSVSFSFLLELSFVSAVLPSVVFLGMSLPHSHLTFFPPENKNFENLCLLICMTSISPEFLLTEIFVKWPYS